MIGRFDKYFEKEVTEILSEDSYQIRQYGHEDFDNIIDIGANAGLFSLFARILFPQANIFSIEPNPECLEYLKSNLNIFDINILDVALGDGDPLYYKMRDDNNLSTRYIKENIGTRPSQSMTLKQIIDHFNIDINKRNMFKCDCEGGEVALLDKESTEILKTFKHIGIEVHFQGRDVPFEEWLTYEEYDEWIRKNFSYSHDVFYHKSNRWRGHGIFCMRRKNDI